MKQKVGKMDKKHKKTTEQAEALQQKYALQSHELAVLQVLLSTQSIV